MAVAESIEQRRKQVVAGGRETFIGEVLGGVELLAGEQRGQVRSAEDDHVVVVAVAVGRVLIDRCTGDPTAASLIIGRATPLILRDTRLILFPRIVSFLIRGGGGPAR